MLSGRLSYLVAKLLPLNVRYVIVMEEFVRTPKGEFNSAGVSAEEVLRSMLRRKLARKGQKMADVIRLTPDNVDELAERTKGRRVTEIDPFDSNNTYVALNIPTPGGIKRVHENDYVIEHANGTFDVMSRHEVQ